MDNKLASTTDIAPTPPCSRCGGPRDRHPERYCTKCHAAWMREHRPRHSELTDEQRKKANCRAYTKVLIKRGTLVPQPCERCGEVEVQAHHPDYSDPRRVEWLCKQCHRALHQAEGR